MDVSIVIVHYNTPLLTYNCIDSVFKNSKGVKFEVIVVDNASTVHDSFEIKQAFPEIVLLKSESNLGFAKGNNLGIAQAKGKYILLLNSDTVLKDNAIWTCYHYLETHPKAGVVSARLVFPDGRIQSACQRFPSIKYTIVELLRLQKIIGAKKSGKFLLGSFFDHQETLIVDWVWGTFFFFRNEILNKLPSGKLDTTYFMYCEDMQWCWDIRKLGYEIHYCIDAEVIHIMGGSNAKKHEMIQQNTKLFMNKNYSELYNKIYSGLEKILQSTSRRS